MLSCTPGARIRIMSCAAAVDDTASSVGAVTVSSSANTFEASATWTELNWPSTTSTITVCSAYPAMTIRISRWPAGRSNRNRPSRSV